MPESQDTGPFRHFPTSNNFRSESDTKDSDNFRGIPIRSKSRITRPGSFSLELQRQKYLEDSDNIEHEIFYPLMSNILFLILTLVSKTLQ